MRLSSKGKEGLLGAYSAVVLGCAPNSLPCLISVKGKTIRCDSINEEYITGGEWETGGLVVRFRGNDILTERDGGKSRECVTVTCSGVQLNQQGVTKSDFPPLPTLHLCQGKVSYWSHQGPCPRLRFTSLPRQTLTTSYLGVLGTLMTSTPSVVQQPSAPPPRVMYHDGVMIPKGLIADYVGPQPTDPWCAWSLEPDSDSSRRLPLTSSESSCTTGRTDMDFGSAYLRQRSFCIFTTSANI